MTHCGNETVTLPFYVGSQFDARKAPFELISLDCNTRTAIVAGQTFRGTTTYYWTVNEYMENGTFIGSTNIPPTTNNILNYTFHTKTHHGSICLAIDIGGCGISQQRCSDFTSPCPRGLRIGQTPLVGEQTPEQTGFLLYPNPVKDQLTLKLPEIPATPVTLEIISAHGQLVKSVTHRKAGQTLQLPVTQLAAGQYILKIRYNKNLLTQKFIKE